MTPQEENARIQQQVNEELRAYSEAQRLATKETEKSAEIEAKAAGLTATGLQILEKLYNAQLQYTLAMAKGKKGASQFNDGIDAMTEATQMAAVALSLLVPGGFLIKGVVAGLTFLATQAMKTAAEMQKAANDQADATYKAFQAFSKAGATGADGLKGFFNDVNRMRLNVNELEAMAGAMANNAQAMTAMGGTVYKARKEFADLVQNMKPFEKGMLNLGMSYDDQAEALLGFMKMQAAQTRGQQTDYGKLTGAAKKYIVETEILTRVLGLSRKQQEEVQERQMSNQRSGAALRELELAGRGDAVKLLKEQVKVYSKMGPSYEKGYNDLLSGQIGTVEAQQLLMVTNGKALQDQTDIIEGRITSEKDAMAATQETSKEIGNMQDSMLGLAKSGAYEDIFGPFQAASEAGKIGANNLAESVDDARTQVETLTGTIGKVDGQLDRFTSLIKSQNEQMLALQASLNGQFSTASADGGFMAKLMKAFEPLTNIVMRLVDIMTPLATGILDLFIGALSGVIKLLTLDFVGAFGDFKGAIGSYVDGAAETSKRFADGIKDLLSAMAGNLLKAVEFITGPLGPVFENVGKVVSGFGDSVKTGLAKFTDALVDVVKDLFSKLTSLLSGVGKAKEVVGNVAAKGTEYAQTGAQAVKAAGDTAVSFLSSVFGAATAPAGGGKPAGGGTPPAVPAKSAGGGSAPASAPAPASKGDGSGMQRTPNNAPPPDTKKGGSGAMDDAATKAMIAGHEGIRLKPYKDSLGLWTVGVGHLIGDGKSLPDNWNRSFSKEEVMTMFDKDYDHHKAAAESKTPNFGAMSGAMKSAFVDLAFNMGPTWMSKWPMLQKQLNSKDATGAAANLADSKWATQVGNRADTIVGMVKSGFAANGGIFDGPKSGYPMTLHGEEAVIPLKDSAVPVTMSKEFNTTAANLGELVNIMKNNVGMQATMLAVLEDMRRSQSNTADNTSRMAAVASN